jgi:hypothetical protein
MSKVPREVTPSEREAKARLQIARRVAQHLSWTVLRKHLHPGHSDGYQIVHRGKVVSGAQYDLTVEDVFRLCIEEAHRQNRAF